MVKLFSYVFFYLYTAVLVGELTVPTPKPKIDSFNDILANEMQMATLKSSSLETMLKEYEPPSVLYDIYQKTMKDNPKAFQSSIKDLVDNVLGNNIVIS